MRQMLASAWVIARRDYAATVFSRVFVLFLLTPIFSLLFGGAFALIGHRDDTPSAPPVIAVLAQRAEATLLLDARQRLVARLGDDALPGLDPLPGRPDTPQEARRLLAGDHYVGVLSGPLSAPDVTLSGQAPDRSADDIALILDTARTAQALRTGGGRVPPPVMLKPTRLAAPEHRAGGSRTDVASGAQTGVFFLLVLLAGMSLSTFIEEKSNKVIEVLAAAVPVDAIFAGKLAAMLAISLTGVAIWVGTGLIGVSLFLPQLFHHLAAPAVGWPTFVALIAIYFMVSYLLLGAVFLGLGSQASSPREVQSMAMPVTFLQLLLFGFATAGVAHPDGALAIAAAIFPWSSPLAMLGRAAVVPTLWPHLAALAWQLLWLALALRVAAGLFRRAVLKSGGVGLRFRRRRAADQ